MGWCFLNGAPGFSRILNPAPGAIRAPLFFRPAPKGEGCAADGRRPEAGYVAGSRGLDFGDLGGDGKVFQGVCVAALGTDERHELLVGRTRGERVLDGLFRIRNTLEFQESGGDVVDFPGEIAGDG